MNMFRKLAWAAMVATTGLPASMVAPMATRGGAAPDHSGPRSDALAVKPVPAAVPAAAGDWPGWPWPFATEDALEDEFEGEGWSFWGE
jgi:hypothetical protein